MMLVLIVHGSQPTISGLPTPTVVLSCRLVTSTASDLLAGAGAGSAAPLVAQVALADCLPSTCKARQEFARLTVIVRYSTR
jgi:hypothetical protein